MAEKRKLAFCRWCGRRFVAPERPGPKWHCGAECTRKALAETRKRYAHSEKGRAAYAKGRKNYRSKPGSREKELEYHRRYYRTNPVRRAKKLASRQIYGHPEREFAALLALAAKMEEFMQTIEATDIDRTRAEIAGLTTEQLREEFARGLRIARDQLLRLAAVLAELESRAEQVDGDKHLLKMLRRIASGELLVDAVVKFAGQPYTLAAVAKLPAEQQQRVIDGEEPPPGKLKARKGPLVGFQPTHKHRQTDDPSECTMDAPSPIQQAAKGSPGDVAEMCLSIVQASSDPEAVAARLVSDLQKMLSERKKRRPVAAW